MPMPRVVSQILPPVLVVAVAFLIPFIFTPTETTGDNVKTALALMGAGGFILNYWNQKTKEDRDRIKEEAKELKQQQEKAEQRSKDEQEKEEAKRERLRCIPTFTYHDTAEFVIGVEIYNMTKGKPVNIRNVYMHWLQDGPKKTRLIRSSGKMRGLYDGVLQTSETFHFYDEDIKGNDRATYLRSQSTDTFHIEIETYADTNVIVTGEEILAVLNKKGK